MVVVNLNLSIFVYKDYIVCQIHQNHNILIKLLICVKLNVKITYFIFNQPLVRKYVKLLHSAMMQDHLDYLMLWNVLQIVNLVYM